MSIPIQIKFFREIELYQELKKLNERFKKSIHSDWKVWNTEKKILEYYYVNLVALNTEIKIEEIRCQVFKEGSGPTLSELYKDFDMGLSVPLTNLVRRGYATGDNNKISLTPDGLLMGHVINSCYKRANVFRYNCLYYLTWTTVLSLAFTSIISFLEKLSDIICKWL